MEEKKFPKSYSSLWSVPDFGSRYQSFLGKFNFPKIYHTTRFLNKKRDYKTCAGFTLIEMVVTIGILAVLAVTALAILNPIAQFQKANDAKRKGDLSQIQKALETYYQDAQQYPLSTGNTGNSKTSYLINTAINGPSCLTAPGTACKITWGSSWQPYMNVVPTDPSSSKRYVYFTSPDGQTYYLYASLDKGTTVDACNAAVIGSICNTNACGGTCNFGVSSPNAVP